MEPTRLVVKRKRCPVREESVATSFIQTYVEEGTTLKAKATVQHSGGTWYKVGPNSWVSADDVEPVP